MKIVHILVFMLLCLFTLPAVALECENCHDPGIEIMSPQIESESLSEDLNTTIADDSYILATDTEGNESLYITVDSSDGIDYLVDTAPEGVSSPELLIRVQGDQSNY